MHRSRTSAALAVTALVAATFVIFGPASPATAAVTPVLDFHGFSTVQGPAGSAGGIGGTVSGPNSNSAVSVSFAMSSAAECPHVMSGPGIEVTTAPAFWNKYGSDFPFSAGFASMTAGWWVWGTATVDGVTSDMTECQRIYPTDPKGVSLDAVTRTSATISFAPSLGTTSLRAQVRDSDGNIVAFHEIPPTSPVTIDGLTPGKLTMVDFVAINDLAGEGLQSNVTPVFAPPFRSIHLLTNQQFADFAGRAPTEAEAFDWADWLLKNQAADPAPAFQRIDTLVDDPNWGGVQSPIIRLYRAFFLRTPDQSGFAFWTTRRRSGWKLGNISAAFAKSSEFRHRYGALTNRQFVELIYQNVLGRTGDPSGISYWTARLDARTKSRGQVMLEFSESTEFKTRSAAAVSTVNVFTGMLRRAPTTAEVATWAPTGSTPPPRVALIGALFASESYAARFT